MANTRPIIGLIGIKGAGKDTVAQYLMTHYAFKRTAFADKLYAEVSAAFNVSPEFLGNRATKETDLPELALVNCGDPAFVQAVLEELAAYYERTNASIGTVDEELSKPRSPRFIMQLWGTEYRRKRGVDNYWLLEVSRILDASPTTPFCVTDVRFNNEGNFVEQDYNGILLRVRRPALEESVKQQNNASNMHPSEQEMLSRPVFAELNNEEGNPDSLIRQLASVMESLLI